MEEILSSIKRIIAEEGDEATAAPRGLRRGRLEVVASEPAFEAQDDAPVEIDTVDVDEDDILELTPPTEAEAEAKVAAEAEPEAVAEDVIEEEAAVAEDAPIELTPPDATDEIEVAEEQIIAEDPADETVAGETAVEESAVADVQTDPVEEPAPVVEQVLELTDEIETEKNVTPAQAALSPVGAEKMISVESEVAARHSLSALSSMVVSPESGETNTLEGMVREMIRPMLREWLDARLPELVEGMVAKEIARITGGVR